MTDLYELALRIKSEGLTEAKRALQTIETQGKSVAARFAGVGSALTGIGAAAAGIAIGKFLKDAIGEATEAEAVLSELRQTVNNAGGDFTLLAPTLDNAANKMAKLTRFSDDAARGALTRMIAISGDTEASLNNLGLAADFAAYKHISLEKSGELVGKVMTGNTKVLRELGITTKDSAEALEQMRQKFRGMAEGDGRTLQGRLEQIRNAWKEVLEAAGKALTGADSLPDALGRVATKLNEVAGWIDRMAPKWASWAQNAIKWVGEVEARMKKLERVAFAIYRILHPGREPSGSFADVEGTGSTGVPLGDTIAPMTITGSRGNSPARAGGGGGGSGGGVKIPNPNIDFDSVSRQRISEIGQAPILDMDKEPVPGIGMSVDDLKKIFANYDKAVEENARKTRQRQEEEAQKTADAMNTVSNIITQGMAQTLGDAVYNAFAAAFNGEGLGGIFKAFAKTVLAGVGQIFTQLGMVYLEYGGIMQALSALLPNPFTAGPAGLAIGAALIAMGAALGAVAQGGGGRGTATAGAFRERNNSQEIVRLKFVDRPGYGSALSPAQPIHFTVIGENDPKAQAAIGRIVAKNSRRQG